MSEKHLEDFAVGQTYGSGRLTVNEARIKSFAAEFDPQPYHLDHQVARASIFGTLVASGWHTAAITCACWSGDSAPVASSASGSTN